MPLGIWIESESCPDDSLAIDQDVRQFGDRINDLARSTYGLVLPPRFAMVLMITLESVD